MKIMNIMLIKNIQEIIVILEKNIININDFKSDRNYFITYIYGAHLALILSTIGRSPHILPISFYLRTKKTTYIFKEWDLLSYSSIYSFFNASYYIENFKDEGASNDYFDYDTNKVWKYVDRAMSKKLYYSDPLYLIKIKSIFGYGGYCHYTYLFHDIKHNARNDVNIVCYRIKRNNNIYNLALYWVLVQGMFLASLLKEIILILVFLRSLFIKYGLVVVFEKCYLKYLKKQNKDTNNDDDVDLIPLSSIDIHEICPEFNGNNIMRKRILKSSNIDSFKYSILIPLHYYISYHRERM